MDEKTLKQILLEKIEKIVLELGVGFSFIGSEVRLGNHRCDLLFFNIEHNCYVVIELKTRKLEHVDIGQIKYYVEYINKNIKKERYITFLVLYLDWTETQRFGIHCDYMKRLV